MKAFGANSGIVGYNFSMSMFSLSRTEPFKDLATILSLMLLTKNQSKPEPEDNG